MFATKLLAWIEVVLANQLAQVLAIDLRLAGGGAQIHGVTSHEIFDVLALEHLNELEYVDGELFANIWQSDLIARIDPNTGNVTGYVTGSILLCYIISLNEPLKPFLTKIGTFFVFTIFATAIARRSIHHGEVLKDMIYCFFRAYSCI